MRPDRPAAPVRGPMVAKQPPPTPPPAEPRRERRGGGGGTLAKVLVLLAVIVGVGVAAGAALSQVDAVVVVEERADLPDWVPFAVAGGVVVAGLLAFVVGGPRPELLPSWAGLVLITYGSGLGLERVQELDTTGTSSQILAQLDTTESILLAGAALIVVGQALAIRRWLSPRPIAAVRALLGTGLLTVLAIGVALTSVLSAEVTVGAGL